MFFMSARDLARETVASATANSKAEDSKKLSPLLQKSPKDFSQLTDEDYIKSPTAYPRLDKAVPSHTTTSPSLSIS